MPKPINLGKYEILEEIGRGGFAVVYKARDTTTPDHIVALKVLHPQVTNDPVFIQRFRQEASTAANLHHPNIVTVYDFGETDDGVLYLAMTLVGQGHTLRDLLTKYERLTLKKALQILTPLAAALDYLHHRDPPLVHRDVKPANVLLSTLPSLPLEGGTEGEGEAPTEIILTDFGLVRSLEASTQLTQSGTILGTPAYLAPEQADPKKWGSVTPLTDVYALGIVAYEMLAGRTPFQADTPLSVLRAHADDIPPSPLEFAPTLGQDLADVLTRALAKPPDERYLGAGALVAALKQAVEAEALARQRQEQLVERYEKLQRAISDQDWSAAEAHCHEILALEPEYQKLPELWMQVREVQARLDHLYQQVQTALQCKQWEEALRHCANIETLSGPVYRDVPGLRRQAEAGQQRQQAEQDHQALLARLYTQLQAAAGREDWSEALILGRQIQALEPDYRDVSDLKAHAREELDRSRPRRSIPGWAWAAIGVVAVVLLIALGNLPFGRRTTEEPTPAFTEVPISIPTTEPIPTDTPMQAPTDTPSPVPTSWTGPCRIESFEAKPSSPQSIGSLVLFNIHATCESGVRAIRLLINGEWYGEKGGHIAPPDEFVPTWPTEGLSPGNYEITAEVATWGDDDWEFSASQTITYVLTSITQTRPSDDMVMVYVPDGAFRMGSTEDEIDAAFSQCEQDYGSDECTLDYFYDETHPHTVTLGAFWIDQTEVTNAQYRQCVEAGVCQAPIMCDWEEEGKPTYGDVSKADHPVICVEWYDAETYCEWAGGMLPTEAEWEYAARGEQGSIFPWGNSFDGAQLNFCDTNCPYAGRRGPDYDDGYERTSPVGNLLDGASWCGALDMAGNVWEWVADWYSGTYPSKAQTNPAGPKTGNLVVSRGGSWFDARSDVRTAYRLELPMHHHGTNVGFRCVTHSAGDTRTRSTDGMVMVYVPGGTLEMGSTDAEINAAFDQCEQVRGSGNCDRAWYERESPKHLVTLDPFWIDQTEVTNAQYALCVTDGECNEPPGADESNFDGDDYPVVNVSWNDAMGYCTWAGAQLPTEAQWEYAGRGEQGHIYPWGNDFDCSRGNFDDETAIDSYVVAGGEGCDGYGSTAPVGSFPTGASWCDALDVAGNVWEWVADWHGVYPSETQANPTGPTEGEYKVLRGGSFKSYETPLRASGRHVLAPTGRSDHFGFRCAVTVAPGP